MNLELSEEQTAVRRLAKDFVDREIAPHVVGVGPRRGGRPLAS